MNKYFIIFVYCILFIGSCNKSNPPDFFHKYRPEDKTVERSFAIIPQTILFGGKRINGYDFKFTFYAGREIGKAFHSFFEIDGFLYQDREMIYCLPKAENKPFVFVDFGAKVGEVTPINFSYYKKNMLNEHVEAQKKYQLRIDTIFFCQAIVDTVFKVRFESIGIMYDDDDLVLYLSKERGVLAYYNALVEYPRDSAEEKIFFVFGDTSCAVVPTKYEATPK